MTMTEPLPAAPEPRNNTAAQGGGWVCLIHAALVLWILRVPVATTALGWLLLGATTQAQDLFTELLDLSLPSTWLRMLWFVLVLTASWALATHYAARLLVESDREARALAKVPCFAGAATWGPRVLGLLTFLAVEFAIWRSDANMPTLDESHVKQAAERALIAMAVLVAAAAAAYLVWIFRRPHGVRLSGRLGRLSARLAPVWRVIAPGRVPGSAGEEGRDVGRLILVGVFVIFIVIFLFGADRVAGLFPRATAVPLILGGWLPFLSYLSGVGRQIRAPLISGLMVLIVLLAAVLGDNHAVRRIPSQDRAFLPMENAVVQWMTENGCNQQPDDGASAPPCPRPIIVAAAGGASRAGFMMASIIGYFLDTTEGTHYGVTGLTAADIRKRIFAISSVSGGSMGAVMVTAALNASPPASINPPCANEAVDQWWGVKVNNWRDCFEALTSGDFLTADFFGLAFNDALPFAWRDRAAVLEDSWRNRFGDVVPVNKDDAASSCGLDCPFLSLRPRPGHWIPLLVLNGTSEATGGRIVTTPLAPTYKPKETCPAATASACPLFVGADNFHDLLKMKIPGGGWTDWLGLIEPHIMSNGTGDDVRLSTAALNSARFPLISPPGSIRNGEQQLIDRIVDGGYFENYGALAAKELAVAVHAVAPQLRPLVIVISNDPADMLSPADDATPDQPDQPRPHAAGSEVWSEVHAPLNTFAHARTAHGVLGVNELEETLHAAITDCARLVIQVRIWPDGDKPLSMSWWESPLVQRQIHRQTEQSQGADGTRGADKNQNASHLAAIWQELKESSCGVLKSAHSSGQ
jgi:hypothetical protein